MILISNCRFDKKIDGMSWGFGKEDPEEKRRPKLRETKNFAIVRMFAWFFSIFNPINLVSWTGWSKDDYVEFFYRFGKYILMAVILFVIMFLIGFVEGTIL